MNEYEMMTVFHPRMNPDETAAAVAALEEQVVANGGEMLSIDDWGHRRLAYPIDGVIDGTYVLMTFKMPPAGTVALERWIRLSETTLRHLLIRGIIPFEGDRSGRDERRDDRDERDERDEDWTPPEGEAPDEDRGEAAAPSTPSAEAADAPAEETPEPDDGEAVATASED